MLFLHGASGFLDEIVIAGAVLGVMWLAIRLAGRAPAEEDEEQTAADAGTTVDDVRDEPTAVRDEPTPPPAPPVGLR